MPPISPSPRPYSNRFHRDTQESRLHSTTIPQPFLQPQPNHASTILRVESKNDSDSTIPHPRSFNSNRKTARQNCRALKSFTGEVQSDSGESAANAVEGAPEIGGFAVGVVKNYS